MEVIQLGVMRYGDAMRIMDETHAKVSQNPTIGGVVLVVQHPPVVTMGNRFLKEDMIASQEELEGEGIDFAKTDRGGSVTIHEPGQCVVYPLIRLNSKTLTVRKFVWILEESMIRTCAHYGIFAARDDINPGVWVGMNKVGALGIRVKDHVSRHGLAFNISNRLATFQKVVPCGLRGRGVTSLLTEISSRFAEPSLSKLPTYSEVESCLVSCLTELLEREASLI